MVLLLVMDRVEERRRGKVIVIVLVRGKSQWTLVREGNGNWIRCIWIFTRVNLIVVSGKRVKGLPTALV